MTNGDQIQLYAQSSTSTLTTVNAKIQVGDREIATWEVRTGTGPDSDASFTAPTSRTGLAPFQYYSSSAVQVRGTGYTNSRITISSGYSINAWNHFVLTRETDGTQATQKVYLNGVEMDSRTYNITANFNILNFGLHSSIYYTGEMDEISTHAAGLSASDVSAIYNSGSPTDLTGLYNITGWWRMGDDSTGTTVNDVVGSNDLTAINGVNLTSTNIP